MNFLRYAWGSLMINQFKDRNVSVFGESVLSYYGLSGYSEWEFLGYETLFFIGIFFATWAALEFKRHVKR